MSKTTMDTTATAHLVSKFGDLRARDLTCTYLHLRATHGWSPKVCTFTAKRLCKLAK